MAAKIKTARKFALGQRVWRHRSEDGTPKWEPATVAEVNPRSYVFRRDNAWQEDEKMETSRAERLYLSEGEKYQRDWDRDHRRAILRLIEKADVMTLQVVGKAIGFEAKQILDGFGW